MSFKEELAEPIKAYIPDVFEKTITADRLPFRFMSRSQLPNHLGQMKGLYMKLQQIAVQLVILLAKKHGKKLKLLDRRLSRKTKKKTRRKMSLKQKKAINRGRKKAGLALIKWKK